MKKIGWKEFSFFIGIYVLIWIMQSLIGYFSIDSIKEFYANLQKAPWTPPNWLFGPAWTILYVLIALSVWLIYLTRTKNISKNKAYVVFFVQLFFNFIWSLFFFFLKSPLLGLICIVALLALIACNIYYFYKINKIAALILLPYLIWVCFATTLNFYIVLMN